jgi:hypothetical protein
MIAALLRFLFERFCELLWVRQGHQGKRTWLHGSMGHPYKETMTTTITCCTTTSSMDIFGIDLCRLGFGRLGFFDRYHFLWEELVARLALGYHDHGRALMSDRAVRGDVV